MKKLILASLLVFVLAFALVSADGDLTATIDSSSESGDPGADVSFTVTLSNGGAATISALTTTSSGLTDGSNTITAPSITDVTDLEVGTDQTVTVTVTVPVTEAGTYSGTITITDDADAANTEDIPYSVVVNSVDAYSVDVDSVNFELFADESASDTFTLTNEGSTTLTSWVLSFTSEDGDSGLMEDDDGDEITVILSDPETSLAPGDSMTITVSIDAEDGMDTGDFNGDVAISAKGDTTVTNSVAINVEIEPRICEDGKQGSDFDINIEEPESNDDFKPGETVTVEVEVENKNNDDLDVEVEVTLYNLDTGKKEEVVSEDREIQEDETETFNIDIDLPTDLDEDDTYYIYVQVHEDGNEDDSCDFERVQIDIEREDEDAVITDVSLSPSSGLACGDDYRLTVYVESVGKDELNDVYIEVLDGDLDLSEISANFDLGDYNDKDNDQRESFDLVIPEDADEGNYYIEVIVYDDNGNQLDSELVLVEVSSCSASSTSSDDGDANLRVTVDDEYEVTGDELTIALLIENTGDSATEIEIDIDAVAWATLDSTEYLKKLNAGDTIHAYLYLTLDLTTTGKHDLQVVVTDGDGNEVTEIVTVDFGEEETVEEADGFFSSITGWFSSKAESTGTFWIIADIILVILALVFLRMLFSRK